MELTTSNTESENIVINIIGASYRTAPISLLEALARIPADLLIREFKEKLKAEEICLIPTCNRFEIIFTGNVDRLAVISVLKNLTELEVSPDCFYFLQNTRAITHFYRLAASLDSMFVGETQIVGQIRKFYRKACERKNIGKYLHRLFQSALELSRTVRSNVGLTCGHVSVSSVAVNKAAEILGGFEGKNILLIGAGETARICLEYLHNMGARDINILNRTVENAAALAEKFNCGFGLLNQETLKSFVPQSSLIISAVSSNQVLLDLNHFASEHQQVFIDLSIPRSIKAADEFSPQILIAIQALQAEAEVNRSRRAKLAKGAESLVAYQVIKFNNWLRKNAAIERIIKYREVLESVCESEFDYLVSRKIIRNLPGEDLRKVKRLFINRLCHKLIFSAELYSLRENDFEENLREQFSAVVVKMGLTVKNSRYA